jgi:phosphatidylinositol-3-phosphatase
MRRRSEICSGRSHRKTLAKTYGVPPTESFDVFGPDHYAPVVEEHIDAVSNEHPPLPNYLWLDGGQCFSYCGTDNPPQQSPNGISSTATLHHLLSAAGISWTEYAENITDGTCPMSDNYPYATRHNPFIYFNDVNGSSSVCTAHEKSFSDLSGDLVNNAVTQYNFITPNLCDDMHDSCSPTNDAIKQGDTWLQNNLPMILGSSAYKNGGAVLITWDEGVNGDGPVGMIVLSPDAEQRLPQRHRLHP